MKIVFMGTPEFAVPSLKMLMDKYDVRAVLTQPDRPKGRGKKLAFSPVKEAAVEKGVKVYQPLKLKNDPEVIGAIKEIEPDFIIVVAFGQILPKEVLDIPKYGCINLHASLLPKYRGAAPINWCIINGEKISGNTTMLMDVGLDTGDMLLKSEYKITDTMTYGELHDILMEDGSELLFTTIEAFVNDKIEPVKQNHSQSCYASMINKETGKIDWNKSAVSIKDLIRGLNPWPVAYTLYKGENMKIYKASSIDETVKVEPGTIVSVSKNGIKVASGEGMLLIEEIQFPNGKRLKIEEYIKGNTIETEIKLGL
jgi:methionyl-tRNA formyltransferase